MPTSAAAEAAGSDTKALTGYLEAPERGFASEPGAFRPMVRTFAPPSPHKRRFFTPLSFWTGDGLLCPSPPLPPSPHRSALGKGGVGGRLRRPPKNPPSPLPSPELRSGEGRGEASAAKRRAGEGRGKGWGEDRNGHPPLPEKPTPVRGDKGGWGQMFAPLGEKPLAPMRSPFQGLPDSPSGLWYLSLPLQRRAEVGIPAIRVR